MKADAALDFAAFFSHESLAVTCNAELPGQSLSVPNEPQVAALRGEVGEFHTPIDVG